MPQSDHDLDQGHKITVAHDDSVWVADKGRKLNTEEK